MQATSLKKVNYLREKTAAPSGSSDRQISSVPKAHTCRTLRSAIAFRSYQTTSNAAQDNISSTVKMKPGWFLRNVGSYPPNYTTLQDSNIKPHEYQSCFPFLLLVFGLQYYLNPDLCCHHRPFITCSDVLQIFSN